VRDLSPLRQFLTHHLSPERIAGSGRKLRIGAVACATGLWKEWTEADSALVVDAVMASAAIPYVFEPQLVDGVAYFDGGVRSVAPVESLMDAGCDEIDSIVCSPLHPKANKRFSNALEAGLASVDIMTDQITNDDLRVCVPGGGLSVYRPDRDLGDSLDFEPETNAWRWALGATGRLP